MSTRRQLKRPGLHSVTVLVILLLCSGVACWEQWSESWFPQMKWQKAQQAFERIHYRGQVTAFVPPEGAVAIDAEAPAMTQYDPGVDALTNPFAAADFKSIARGQEVYDVYCATCHGTSGMGDGPVSMTGPISGPFSGVFPLVTAAGRTDGYIYNLIRAGGARMPSYQRISSEDRWHTVNYVRYLQKGGQP